MSTTEGPSNATNDASIGRVDMELETVVIPGRVDPAMTTFSSAGDLAEALKRAEAAHGDHEKRTGEADPNWPDWYAAYMVAEQAGEELPS
jgi:hypothetical protein